MRHNKLFWYPFYLILLTLLFLTDVRAYVDPSVLTYAIQAVAGIAITLGTVAGLYGRKIISFLKKTEKGISADPKQDDLVFHDPVTGSDVRALSFITEDQFIELCLRHSKSEKKQKSRISAGLCVTLAVSFLWMAYSPLMLYIGNADEFRYDFFSILPTVILMFAVGMITGLIVYYCSSRIARPLYSFLVFFGFAFLLITLIQGVFLAKGLPPLDGTKFDWSKYSSEKIKSFILIVAVSAGLFLLYKQKGSQFVQRCASVFSVLITLFLAVTLVITGIQTKGFSPKRSASVTSDEEFTLSSDRNLIILVLDALDSGSFRELMETENPEYREVFRDFTYYPNTVGCYTYTEHAIPYILTGIWMENQEDFISFETKAMDHSPLLSSLEEKGYRMGMYEDALVYDSEGIYRFENVKDDHYKLDSFGEYARQSFYMTWFQYMPYPLKPLLSREDTLSNLQNRAIGQSEAFMSRNTQFYNAVHNDEINVTEDMCFRFIHLEGAHVPFRYDKDANEISMEDGSYKQNIQASITITNAYLELLREKGVFDNSAIIIMADHGFTEENDPLLGRSNPVLLIKGMNEKHEMNISEQPVSYEDLQNTYKLLLDGNITDNLYSFAYDNNRKRRFLSYDYNHPEYIKEYIQDGYASDITTMRETGNVYSFGIIEK